MRVFSTLLTLNGEMWKRNQKSSEILTQKQTQSVCLYRVGQKEKYKGSHQVFTHLQLGKLSVMLRTLSWASADLCAPLCIVCVCADMTTTSSDADVWTKGRQDEIFYILGGGTQTCRTNREWMHFPSRCIQQPLSWFCAKWSKRCFHFLTLFCCTCNG